MGELNVRLIRARSVVCPLCSILETEQVIA